MESFAPLAPYAVVTAVTLLVLLAEAFVKKSEELSFWLTVAGLAAGIAVAAEGVSRSGVAFHGMITTGGFAGFFSALFMIAALLTVVMSKDFLARLHADFGEFYLLILLATLGMMLIASAADLIIVFLGIELMSVCLYVLAGFARQRPASSEAALKYFLLGAFATGFLVYGIALVYGAAGTTSIPVVVRGFGALSGSPIFWAGIGLLTVGLAFKVGAVPFHMWIPDVYQGAPTTVSGFMSTGAKAAAFSAFVILFAQQADAGGGRLRLVLALLAAASMILGNIVAVAQSNIKRMLAYSSIAHAGYMLIGLAAGNQLGRSGIIYYLTAYTFMNVGAFGILSLFEQEEEKNLTFDDYAGLGRRRPLFAALMSVFMLSLAGLPPLAGFFGKYYIFIAAVDAGLTWLAVLGVLMSVVSAYYYLRVIMMMYFRSGETEMAGAASMTGVAALCVAALAVLELGLFPSSILAVINSLF